MTTNKNNIGKLVIASSILLFIYLALFRVASNGYGYQGYYGYHRGSSFWYFNSTNRYYDRNVRGNSRGFRGGGPSSGK